MNPKISNHQNSREHIKGVYRVEAIRDGAEQKKDFFIVKCRSRHTQQDRPGEKF